MSEEQQPERFSKCTYVSVKAAISRRFLTGFQMETQDARGRGYDPTEDIKHATIVNNRKMLP